MILAGTHHDQISARTQNASVLPLHAGSKQIDDGIGVPVAKRQIEYRHNAHPQETRFWHAPPHGYRRPRRGR
jgi:hypothetical protein